MKRKACVTSSRTVEFLPRTFFFVALRETERVTLRQQPSTSLTPSASPPSARRNHTLQVTPGVRYISLDDQLAALESSTADTRSELHETILFCDFLTSFLSDTRSAGKADTSVRSAAPATETRVEGPDSTRSVARVCYFYLRSSRIETETRVIHLICRWRLLHLRLPPLEVVAPFEHLMFLFPTMVTPLSAARATRHRSSLNLLISLQGIAKGLKVEQLASSTASSGLDELRHLVSLQGQGLEPPECGTMIWITSRLVVIAAPLKGETKLQPAPTEPTSAPDVATSDAAECAASEDLAKACQSTTQLFLSTLKQHHMTAVVRLHRQDLDDSQFATNGIELVDLSAPPAEPAPPPPDTESGNRLERFLHSCEGVLTSGPASIIAIHANAGSGITAAFVGCYLMKHLEFTSREAFGWLHACQLEGLAYSHQLFLEQQQDRMWRNGEDFRRRASEEEESDALLARSDILRADANPLHINIGNISLGRHSLFGTKASTTAAAGSGGGDDKMRANGHAPRSVAFKTSHEPYALVAPQDPDDSSTSLASAVQVKRRPLTQGSIGRRPRIHAYHRSGEGVHPRADFAQMHRFLHQTSSLSTPRTAAASGPREVASAAGHTSE